MRIRTIYVAAAMALAAMTVTMAQEPQRPVTSAFTIKAGSAHHTDTYLSPLHYSGWTTAIGYGRMQAMAFNPERWIMALDVDVTAGCTHNTVRNADMWQASVQGRWSMMHRWSPLEALTVGIGGATTLYGGALYLSRNGNNPVAAHASWTVDGAAYATYAFRLGSLPVTALYRATLPVAGAFFAPQYGQLYYEIYMGNSHGTVSPAVWGKYFRLDQMLCFDLRLGHTNLRLGYGVDILSTKANHIVTRNITHTACVGITTQWISLPSTTRIPDNVNALYP